MDAGPPRVIGGCPAAWPVCQRGVCAARAGTVLTIRKQLHPALRGQDHCPGTYQEPSSDPFQKRTLPASMCEWKRKQRVRVGGFLCPQKALSDKPGMWPQ
ncbi:uncharacterized protein ACIBXB_012284 isoform 6-T6 [Morphnus guianensis]